MITPTTREEWAEAFCDWRDKVGLSRAEISDMIGTSTQHVIGKWFEVGRVPREQSYRARIRELCGIDLEPMARRLIQERTDKALAKQARREIKRQEMRGQYDRYGAGGVPVPNAPTSTEIEAGFAALRRTGGYGPHDLTRRLTSKGPRFVPVPRQGYAPTQSGLADFIW